MSPIASTSAVTLDDITVTFTPEASTTTSTFTLTQTVTATFEEPTTVTLTALPTQSTASFYSSLALNATAFERATNASSTATLAISALRTAPYSGALYSIDHSGSASTSLLPTGSDNLTTVSAPSAVRTAILATVITSDELTKAAPEATASSFRSHVGTTIYSHSSSTRKTVASSSAKVVVTTSSSSKRTSRKSTSSRKAISTTHTSTSTTAVPVASSASSSPRRFGASSSQAKAVTSGSSSLSSSSAAAYVFASAAAVASPSSSSSPAAAAIVYATPTSSSSAHASTAASSSSAKGSNNGTATRASNVATFFSSLGSSPGSIAGTVAVAAVVAVVVAGLAWLFIRYCRSRRARHVQLGSEGGSPDLDGDFDEKALRAGPAYAAPPADEEAAIEPEAIWARRLSQLQLSLVGGHAAEDEEDTPAAAVTSSIEAESEWTPSGNKMTVAQHLRQSRRMSPRGSTPPPPPPTMALPQLPASARLANPRASHPLRQSATVTRSPSLASIESEGRQVLLGGSPVSEETVQMPARPGSWRQSLDQVMTSTADFLLGRSATAAPLGDLEAQEEGGEKYTVFRSQSVAVRRSPLASEFEDEEGSELGYAAGMTGTGQAWAGQRRANTLSGPARAVRPPTRQLMLPLIVEERAGSPTPSTSSSMIDPFADPEPAATRTSTPLEQLSAMLDLGMGDLFDGADDIDKADDKEAEQSTLHRAATASSPVARSPARLVTLSRAGTVAQPPSQHADLPALARSRSVGSVTSAVSASQRLSRHSIDGASLASADAEQDESDDAASILTVDSGRVARREQKEASRDAHRRASMLVVERRRRSEGFALGPRAAGARGNSVTSLV